MSDAAVAYVKTCAHPRVNKVARALLVAIAQLVPEGDTTTPLIGMGELAKVAQLHRRTVWRWLDVLVEIGEVRVVDGLQGRPARYTLVHVVGTDPIAAAPLPLLGAAAPRRPRPRSPLSDGTPSLFDDPAGEEPAINRSQGSQGSQVSPITWITRITSWAVRTITRITSWRPFVRSTGEELVIGTCDPCDPPAPPLEVPIASRARDVHTSEEVHTHPWHAWCGRVCVPKALHQEFLRKGHATAWLLAFYARRCAAIGADERITADDFAFWRTAMKAELATSPVPAPAAAVRARPTFGAGNIACPHEPMCRTIGDCSERILTEARAARERKSG